MPKRLTVAWLLILTASSLCAAQGSGEKPKPQPPSGGQEGCGKKEARILKPGAGRLPQGPAVKPAELPQGEGAWVVQVVTRGGFAGVGKGDVTVGSDGSVACVPPGERCNQNPSPEALRALGQAVLGARPEKWGEVRYAATCHDCYATVLVVRRRGPDGAERTYTTQWDDVTQGDVPAEAREIHAAAVKLASVEK